VPAVVASNQKTTAGTTASTGTTNATFKTNGVQLSSAQKNALAGPPLATSFAPDARLYRSFDDANVVFDYGNLDLDAMREMLSEDGNPRKLEQVLSLPIRSADWEIRGSGEIADFVRANLDPIMDRLIAQCCSAIAYRKAFFELVWRLEDGKVVYDAIELRPATACSAAYAVDTGQPTGFRQRLNPIEMFKPNSPVKHHQWGYVTVPDNRAFVYTYGAYREPVHGISDLDVSLYCWDNIRKLQFLWCQYLEQQSLPKVIVYGDDPTQAQDNAQMIAESAASSAIPLERRYDPASKTFELLESSGKGASQFKEAIAYFEAKQTQSVLASFMDLAEHAHMGGAGSNALSADQSEFYLASRQAVANEIGEQVTEGIIRPLVTFNYGPDAEMPDLHFGPIGNRQVDRAMSLLTSIITAEKPTVPEEFTGFLLNQVSAAMGLDTTDVADAVQSWGEHRQKMMEAAEAAAAAAAEQPVPLAPPTKQQPLPGAEDLADGESSTENVVPAAAPAQASNAKARRRRKAKTGTANGGNHPPARVPRSATRGVRSTDMALAIDMTSELMAQVKAGRDPTEFLKSIQTE
jgi:hypothetical protein